MLFFRHGKNCLQARPGNARAAGPSPAPPSFLRNAVPAGGPDILSQINGLCQSSLG